MATLAAIYDRLLGKANGQAVEQTRSADHRTRTRPDYQLRPFPMEDVHLYVKRIDNTRVIRQVDPDAPRVCWKTIGGASAVATLLIGILLPNGYNLFAGYQIEELRKQQEHLTAQISALELEEAKLLSPRRLAELAKQQNFVDPAPGQVIHLDGRAAVALRRESKPASSQQ